MKKVLLVISLIAWSGIQHFDLIRNSYEQIKARPANDLLNFETRAFHDLQKPDLLDGKTFFMKPIKVERISIPAKPESRERKSHGIRITNAPGESATNGVFSLLKS